MITKNFLQLRSGAATILALLTIAGLAQAQAHASKRGGTFGFGLGFGRAGFAVGQLSNDETGVALHARFGAGLSERTLFLLAAEVQPFKVENPVAAESYSSFYLLPSLQIYLSKAFYVRPGLGLQFRSWSGESAITNSDSGPAFGLALGREIRLTPQWALAPEFVAHWAVVEFEGSVSASFYGVQFTIAR